MGDIDFEEQLELERLEQEKRAELAKEGKGERVDPDGTVYEWDAEKQAWFPKIDSDFIAQYQMNYGEEGGGTEGEPDKPQTDYEKYYNYYQNYNQAQLQHEEFLKKQKKEQQAEESHEETLQKLEDQLQEQADTEQQSSGYQTDSKEDMEKYTEEQKKQYNEYWSYYYSTEYHDYYADCMAQYAASGDGVGEGKGEKEEKKEEEQDGKKKAKKRKGQQQQQQQRDEGWFNVDEQHNTSVYVSGLPFDITPDEFKDMMTKYGLVMFDPRTKQPKLKLYVDESGQPKGDGRCCFIKKESVDLVLNLLDGSDYRGHKIQVERAQFQLKGDYDPSKKKKKLSNKEKRRLKERQAKLFDWRPDQLRGARMKHEKVVVLKNVFDPKTFEDDPMQINTLTKDIRTECANYGEVKKVVVYDRHEDGVVIVHFKEAEEADMCVQNLNQRYFAKRRLLAATWDGNTKYEVQETEAEREARIKKWEQFLESGEKEGTPASSDGNAAKNSNNGHSVASSSGSDNVISEKESKPTASENTNNISPEDSKVEEVDDSKNKDESANAGDVTMDTDNKGSKSSSEKDNT